MPLCRFIYGVIKEYLRFERVVYVHYISIDDSNSDYYYIEKNKTKNNTAALWSCSGRPGASRIRARCRFAAEICMAK